MSLNEENTEQSGQPEQPKKSINRKTWFSVFWWVVGIINTLLCFVIFFQLLFRYYTDEIVGKVLRDVVEIKSEGLYKLSYNDIKLDFIGNYIEINNLQLVPNQEIYTQLKLRSNTLNKLYQFKMDKVYIEGFNLGELYFQKTLRLNEFQISDFNIVVEGDKSTIETNKEQAFRMSNLFFLISGYLEELKVDNFFLSRGTFVYRYYGDSAKTRYVDRAFELRDIDLTAQGFLIDSLSTVEYPFQLDDFKLKLGYNKLKLSDEVEINIDSLELEAKEQFLVLNNLQLIRKDKSKTAFVIPNLNFKGLDFLKVYLDKELEIDTCLITTPSIKFQANQRNNDAQKSFNRMIPDLYEPLSKYLYSLKLQHLIVNSANVSAANLPKLEKVSLHLKGVHIDSLTHRQRRPIAYSDSISFKIEDFDYNLPDSIHRIAWDELSYSTNTKEAQLSGFTMKHSLQSRFLLNNKRLKQRTLLNINSPKLVLESLDAWQVLRDKSLALEALRLSFPSIQVYSAKEDTEVVADRTINPENLYPIIKGNLKWVKANRINIYKGKFYWQQYISADSIIKAGASGIDLYLNSFELAENTYLDTTRLFQSRNVLLSLQNGFLELPDTSHRVNMGALRFSLQDSILDLTEVSVIPKYTASELIASESKQVYVRANIPKIMLGRAALRQLIVDQEGDFGFLKLIKPKVTVYLPSEPNTTENEGESPNSLSSFSFLKGQQLRIDSGNVQVLTYDTEGVTKEIDLPKISTVINQLSFDSLNNTPRAILASAELNFSIDNYTLLLPDSVHQLTAKRLRLSSEEKTLNLKEVQIQPRSDANSINTTHATLKIPEIDFAGLEVERLIKDSQFVTDTLRISAPNIQTVFFSKKDKSEKSFNWEELPQQLTQSLNLVEVKTFLFEESDINFIFRDTVKHEAQEITIHKISLTIDSCHISPDTRPSIFRPLYSSGVEVSLKSFEHTSKSGTVTFDSLYFQDQIPSTIEIKDFELKSKYPVNSSNLLYFGDQPQYNVQLEKISVDSLNLFELLVQNNLFIRNIALHTPRVKIRSQQKSNTPNSKNEEKSFHTDSLKSLMGKVFNKIGLDRVKVINGEVDMMMPRRDKSQVLAYESTADSTFIKGDIISKTPVIVMTHDKDRKIQIDTIRSRRFRLTNISVPLNKKVLRIRGKRINGEHIDFSTDTLAINRVATSLLHDRINYTIEDINVDLPDTTFSISAKDLVFDTKSNSLTLNNVKAAHRITATELFTLKGEQTDWMDFGIKSLTFKGIDLDEITNQNKLNLSAIRVENLIGEVYRDTNWPFPKNNRPPMPQEALRKLPFHFTLDSLQLRNSTITYREEAEKIEIDTLATEVQKMRTGQIEFRNMQANLLGLTNDIEKLKKGAKAKLYTEALLMGSGKLSANFEFDLADPYNTYRFEGELDSMLLPQLNPMLEKVAYLQIRSGLARRLHFWVTANEEYAVGKMHFMYNNLSISLVDKTYSVGVHEYIFSLIANTFFIRTSNSRFFLFYKDGKIFAPKDPSRSVFNHWAKALLSGVRSSITSWQPKEGKDIIKEWEKENRGLFRKK